MNPALIVGLVLGGVLLLGLVARGGAIFLFRAPVAQGRRELQAKRGDTAGGVQDGTGTQCSR